MKHLRSLSQTASTASPHTKGQLLLRGWGRCACHRAPILLLLGGLLFGAGHSLPSALATSSGACSYPDVTPLPASDCSFDTAVDVAPGGTLTLTVNPATPAFFVILRASSAEGGCSGGSSSASPSLTLTCPDGLASGTPISFTLGVNQRSPLSATLAVVYNANGPEPATETISLASSLPSPPTITYPSGWNLVGGPTGTVLAGAAGSLYTYRAGDTTYEVLPADTPLQAGAGYWAYFPDSTRIALPSVAPQDLTIPLLAGQWAMVGNPFDVSMELQPGAGTTLLAESYDPSSGTYKAVPRVPCCEINPGQGAWVVSSTGGSLTISLGAGPP